MLKTKVNFIAFGTGSQHHIVWRKISVLTLCAMYADTILICIQTDLLAGKFEVLKSNFKF